MGKRVLVIGGTGVFGRRLARHLCRFDGIDLTVTSRDGVGAGKLAQELADDGARCAVTGVALDYTTGFGEVLARLKPWLVIDCSGPFQRAGYEVARAAMTAGAHVIDLADARDYLLGYHDALNSTALENGVTGWAGASSTPGLSMAAVERLTAGWRRVDTIDICITPGGKSAVGQSVIEAVLSYAGRKVPLWREGRLDAVDGWIGSQTVDVPRLGRRRVAPVETADAELLGGKLNVASRVAFHAGLESTLEQRGLAFIARLVRSGFLGDTAWLAPLLVRARRLTRITTSDRGGMLVTVRGLDGAGRPVATAWSLLAENGHGLFVPVMAAAAAVRRLLEGDPEAGAAVLQGQIPLDAIEAEMAPYSISTCVETKSSGRAVFRDALGAQVFERLPAPLAAFHGADGAPVWRGEASVERGSGPVASLVARIVGFPAAGKSVPVSVCVDRRTSAKNGRPEEVWERNFAGSRFRSILRLENDGSLSETFGPFTFSIGLLGDDSGIEMPVSGWRAGWLKLPRFLAPVSVAREFADGEGRFNFDVKLSLPLFGMLVHYRGWLRPADEGAAPA